MHLTTRHKKWIARIDTKKIKRKLNQHKKEEYQILIDKKIINTFEKKNFSQNRN